MFQQFPICYQHRDFIIINKPAGISVHKDNQEIGLTESIAMQINVKKVWLVHRLDKMTSGLLILALNKIAARRFYDLFDQHKVQKTYWALSDKKPKKKQGKISGDMKKARNGRWMLCHTKEKPAITQFFSQSIESSLRHFVLQPKTGRTHQLRVALKSLGCPILGDKLYSGSTADRMYLHAYQLEFEYENEKIHVSVKPTSGQYWHKICNMELL